MCDGLLYLPTTPATLGCWVLNAEDEGEDEGGNDGAGDMVVSPDNSYQSVCSCSARYPWGRMEKGKEGYVGMHIKSTDMAFVVAFTRVWEITDHVTMLIGGGSHESSQYGLICCSCFDSLSQKRYTYGLKWSLVLYGTLHSRAVQSSAVADAMFELNC